MPSAPPPGRLRRGRPRWRDSEDGELVVSGFECLGACDIASMASVDARYYGLLAAAAAIVAALRDGSEVLPEKALARFAPPPVGPTAQLTSGWANRGSGVGRAAHAARLLWLARLV